MTVAAYTRVLYKLYNVRTNLEQAVVDTSSDTLVFTVDAVVRRWLRCGCKRYRGGSSSLGR